MATKTLKTRIKLKHDSFKNLSDPDNQYRLLKGEIACATIDRADPANKQLPPVMFKVGDGEHTFNELTWASALAADVHNWAKASSKPSYTYEEVGADKSGAAATAESNAKQYTDQKIAEIPPAAEYTLEPGTTDGSLVLKKDNVVVGDNAVVTGLKSAAYRESTEFATAAQGTKADNAMPKSGGTATGTINFVAGYTAVLGRAPVEDMEAATKQYVDTEIGKIDQFKYTISTNAATTPKDVIWYNGATKVTGTLVASADTEYNIYLVPCKHSAAQEQEGYDEYLTVKSGSTYSWEVLGNTRDIDLSGYVPTSRKINNKALTADITLAAADVGVNETAFPGLNKVGTVTGVKMNNGSAISPDSNGVVDLGTVITDISGKQDKITATNKLSTDLISGLAAVATSGNYDDLTNRPNGAITGTAGAGKTLTALTQTNGKVSATFGDIKITASQVSDFTNKVEAQINTHSGVDNVGTVTEVTAGVGLKVTGVNTVTPKVEIDEAIEFIFDCGSATVNIEE